MTTQINGDTGVSQCQPNSVSQDDLQSGVVGKGALFRARSTGTPIPTGVGGAVITSWTEDYDTSGGFASNVFTPQIAGWYQVQGDVDWGNTTSALCQLAISKNGTDFNVVRGAISATLSISQSISDLIYLNGTTDNIALKAYQYTATSPLSVTRATFSACLVRAA